MDVTEKWGDDVDSAVKLALIDLKCSIDEVDVEVLEQPSRGFFGIGSKLALVRVSKKSVKKDEPETDSAYEAEEEKAHVNKFKPVTEKKPVKVEAPVEAKKINNKETDQKESQKTVNKVYQAESDEHKRSEKNHRREHRERPHRDEVVSDLNLQEDMKNLPVVENHPAMDFLKDVIKQMGLDLKLTAKADDTHVHIDITGDDSRTIIGKRGQTLDAIQYLTSLVVNKEHKEYIKVVIDAENYRSRREKTLEQLAWRLARKVARTGRSVRLEPMNPYERKVIHATLQNDPKVITKSEGQDPYRRVVIELK